MSWELDDNQREQFERYLFQLQNSRLPLRRLALELYFAHQLLRAAKECRRLPPKLYRILQKFPRLSDNEAWDRMSAEEQADVAAEALREEFLEPVRKGFE